MRETRLKRGASTTTLLGRTAASPVEPRRSLRYSCEELHLQGTDHRANIPSGSRLGVRSRGFTPARVRSRRFGIACPTGGTHVAQRSANRDVPRGTGSVFHVFLDAGSAHSDSLAHDRA